MRRMAWFSCFPPTSFSTAFDQIVLESVIQSQLRRASADANGVAVQTPSQVANQLEYTGCFLCHFPNQSSKEKSSAAEIMCNKQATIVSGLFGLCLRWPPTWGPAITVPEVDRAFNQYAVEALSGQRRVMYFIFLALGVYYLFDSSLISVGNPVFPELDPGTSTYFQAVTARVIEVVSICIMLLFYMLRYVTSSGVVRIVELAMWISVSAA